MKVKLINLTFILKFTTQINWFGFKIQFVDNFQTKYGTFINKIDLNLNQ